jgi:hypothetical protein
VTEGIRAVYRSGNEDIGTDSRSVCGVRQNRLILGRVQELPMTVSFDIFGNDTAQAFDVEAR